MPSLLVFLHIAPDSALGRLTTGALQAEATRRGLAITIHADAAVTPADAWQRSGSTADAVILAAAIAPAQPATAAVPVLAVDLPHLARETRQIIAQLFPEPARALPAAVAAAAAPVAPAAKFLVGVTSCPTGIAHTFMAAEALLRGARSLGYTIKVETRGSVGAKNELTADEIARADAVIVAADAAVETTRFAGKRLLETGTKAAIKDAPALIAEALALPLSAPSANSSTASSSTTQPAPKKPRAGNYKHLMTGVSHMLPLVVAGGLLIALAFAVGGIYAGDQEGTLGWALMQIGGKAAFALFVPVLAGFIAFSIADRPGLTPGLIGGMLAAQLGAGFLGGLVAGFFAGYFTAWLNKSLKLPDSLAGLKPVLLLPLISSLVVGLSMIFLIGPPVKVVLEALTTWLNTMQQGSALTLGLVLGAMMAFDMGGPVNKSAYTFAVGLLASQIYAPMAAVMAAGMVPPLAAALAATLFRDRFTTEERGASKATAILGVSFITEGAIPFAAADPVRVIPCLIAGSAVTGAISMAVGCQLLVPHGGIFVLAIPHAITHGLGYLAALATGTAVATAALYFAKRPLNTKASATVAA